MRFGGTGTVRKLLLCGTVAAAAQGAPSVMARSHHHTTHHHRTTHHTTHTKTGNKASAKKPEQSKEAAPAASAEKLELVPGPTPLPAATPGPRSGANTAAPSATGPAAGTPRRESAATAAAKPVPPPPLAAPPAKTAIATAVAKLFVGEPVYGPKGEQIGRLSKIVTGPDGQVKSAVVTWGGLLGYFQSSRTINWPAAGPSVQGGKLVLRSMNKDELRNAASPRPEASR